MYILLYIHTIFYVFETIGRYELEIILVMCTIKTSSLQKYSIKNDQLLAKDMVSNIHCFLRAADIAYLHKKRIDTSKALS